ncbi:MAG: hypothetical protein AMXMBFR13_35740 [Phycisphaerae bacterium]
MLLIAGVIWLNRPRGFDEQALRDVSGLEVREVSWRPVPNGYRVAAVLTNRDQRWASSVVLIARVLDESGMLLGTNPLINVLNIPPQGSRGFETVVPAKSARGQIKVTIEPAVVSWKE